MRQSVTYKEKSEGFANQTFRLLLVGRSRSGFSSPDSDTNYTLGLAVETITVSSMGDPAVAALPFIRTAFNDIDVDLIICTSMSIF